MLRLAVFRGFWMVGLMGALACGSSHSSSPTARFAYVANYNDGTVSQYAVAADGALSPLTPATTAAGTRPFVVAVEPRFRYAYVLEETSNRILQFRIGADGGLVALSTPTVAAGARINAIGFSPDGRFAYVGNANDETLSQYSIGADASLSC